jgi:serine/threonine protein kinase
MYNYGVVGHAYVIVMKKYDCSLRDWIILHKESLQFKLPILLRIFWQLLQTLLLLHEKSVTHYDIKADNVLLQFNAGQEEPSRVVLGDFGECRIFDQGRDELDMKSRGTECIKSPEMLTLAIHLKKEADNYDRRKKIGTTRASDIWSVGCIFY